MVADGFADVTKLRKAGFDGQVISPSLFYQQGLMRRNLHLTGISPCCTLQ